MKWIKNETFLGLVIGSLLSAFIAGTLVIAAAKAGITPGVSPLVILFGWVIFSSIFKDNLKTKKFLAISQVTGSAGAAITAGVVFTAPAIQLLSASSGDGAIGIDIGMLLIVSFSGTFMGFGFVGLATKKFLKDPKLPAPEAVACDRMIKTAVNESIEPDKEFKKPNLKRSLGLGLILGIGVHFLEKMELIKEDLGLHFKSLGADKGLAIPANAMFIGIGGLLTLPTAILIFAGSGLNYTFAEFISPKYFSNITHFTRWIGAGAMGIAVLWSLFAYFVLDRDKFKKGEDIVKEEDPLLEIDKKNMIILWVSIIIGILLMIIPMVQNFPGVIPFVTLLIVSIITSYLLTNLGGLLSLQVGSSASPVSGTVFIALMILSVFGLISGLSENGIKGALFLMPIIIATCTSICAANDSSQDYKTLQLNGFPTKIGLIPQLVGLISGAIVVPLVLYVAYKSYGFGNGPGELICPQASFYSSILDALFIKGEIPTTPVFIGVGFGIVAVVVEMWGKKRGIILSSLAFAVGIYLPSYLGIGIVIGSVARFMATRKTEASSNEGILAAAGLITGDALLKLVIGIMILVGVPGNIFAVEMGVSIDVIQKIVAAIFIAILFYFTYYNNKQN